MDLDNEIQEIVATTKFFEPTLEFIKWLKKFAGDRLIIDIGCGAGHVTLALKKLGAKAIGIDPLVSENLMRQHPSTFLPHRIEESFIMNMPDNFYIFCRPSHSGFVAGGIQRMKSGDCGLYIGLRENLAIDLATVYPLIMPTTINAPGAEGSDIILYFIKK